MKNIVLIVLQLLLCRIKMVLFIAILWWHILGMLPLVKKALVRPRSVTRLEIFSSYLFSISTLFLVIFFYSISVWLW